MAIPGRRPGAPADPPPGDEPTGVVPGRLRHLPRPTRSAALLLLLAVILELLGRLISSTGVTIAAAAALGAVLGDAVLMPRMDGLRVTRQLADRLTVGVPTTVRLVAQAPDGRRGKRRSLILIDSHPALPSGRTVTPPLAVGAAAVAVRTAAPLRRGYWPEGGQVLVEASTPLGGFVSRQPVALAGQCWVHPAPALPFRLPAADHGTVLGTAASNRSGPGTEFFGIREWRSGDATSSIHWRASARRSQLLVMERERPAHSTLLVVAGPAPEDPARLAGTTGPGPTAVAADRWELAIARAAATAVAAKRSGYTVTLLGGPTAVTPRSPQDILDWFAELEYAPIPTPAAVASARRISGSGATTLWLAGSAPSPAMIALARPGTIVHCLAPTAPGGQ